MINLRRGVGTREDKGGENGEADGEGEKGFVETINGGFVFRRHSIILTFGI